MKILIVENDHFVTKMWAQRLSKLYSVKIADSVKAALEALNEDTPDLIILDLRLNGPTTSGLQVHEFLRENLKQKAPVLFITGLEYNVDLYQRAEQAVKLDQTAGIKTQLLRKPIELNSLSETIKNAAA